MARLRRQLVDLPLRERLRLLLWHGDAVDEVRAGNVVGDQELALRFFERLAQYGQAAATGTGRQVALLLQPGFPGVYIGRLQLGQSLAT